MELGIRKDEVKLSKYNIQWKEEFENILIGVNDIEARCSEYKSALKSLDIQRLRVKRSGEIVLAIDRGDLRTHYIHMVELHSDISNQV